MVAAEGGFAKEEAKLALCCYKNDSKNKASCVDLWNLNFEKKREL